jgi:hypothetical protein
MTAPWQGREKAKRDRCVPVEKAEVTADRMRELIVSHATP